ncbi:MAG: acylphosphatase [Fuerstiella sp.]
MPSQDLETRRIYFSGRVQGVGFRWTTRRLASREPVTGFVRNLHDGRVELVAQGSPEAIERLLSGIRRHFGEHISSADSEQVDDAAAFETFEIRS